MRTVNDQLCIKYKIQINRRFVVYQFPFNLYKWLGGKCNANDKKSALTVQWFSEIWNFFASQIIKI